MNIQLPQDFIDQLNSAIDSDGIHLPFTAPIVWWKHGNKQLKATGDIRYYGGWATNAEEFYAAVGENGALPTGFVDGSFSGNDGEFAVYQTRKVCVAPIATRKRWITMENSKGRSHLQMLCMLASQEDGHFASWGPVVLSAKGLTTREIENSFRTFDTVTAEIRKEIAPHIPTLYFWRFIGTFGKDPEFIKVGSGNNTSNVTYPTIYQPQELNNDLVSSWFVGEEVAGKMVEYRNLAADWLNDDRWKQSKDSIDDTAMVDPNFAGGFMDDLPF